MEHKNDIFVCSFHKQVLEPMNFVIRNLLSLEEYQRESVGQ